MPFASIKDKELFYALQDATDASKNTGLTCFMIHGLGSSNSFYSPITPGLTSAGIRCVAVDTEGNGLSKWSGSEHQSVKTIARDFVDLMDHLGLQPESTVLVGHSMGGITACELAASREYAGVVLLGPVHPSTAVSDAFARRVETVREKGMEAMADTIPLAATGSKSTPLHKAFIRTLLLSQDAKGYISLCNVIAQAEAPDYSRISRPMLFLAGADDKTSPIENIMKIHDACAAPDAAKQVTKLDGVGHWHVIEAAEAVSSHIKHFVQGISTAS